MKGQECEGDAEFWLVMDGATRTAKSLGACEVVGALLPAHKNLLQSLRGMRVEDCGTVLSSENEVKGAICASPAAPSARVSPTVHSKKATEGNRKPQRGALSYNALDYFS